MKGYAFLFWAYTIVWLGIVGYLAFLGARLRNVGARIDRLERSLEAPHDRRDQRDVSVSKNA